MMTLIFDGILLPNKSININCIQDYLFEKNRNTYKNFY